MPDPTEFPEAEQERATALIRSANTTAPAGLRASLEAQIRAAEHGQQHRRWRPESPWRRDRRAGRGIRLGLTVAVAVAVAAVVLVVGGRNTSNASNLQAAAAVALRAPTYPAPAQSGAHLDVSAAGISFPDWQSTVGWRAVGSRADRVHGRWVVTVVYAAPQGQRVGYSIIGGTALTVPSAPVVTRQGITFTVLSRGSTNIVTWQRYGHTCVMTSRTTSASRLINLAVSPA